MPQIFTQLSYSQQEHSVTFFRYKILRLPLHKQGIHSGKYTHMVIPKKQTLNTLNYTGHTRLMAHSFRKDLLSSCHHGPQGNNTEVPLNHNLVLESSALVIN